MGYFVFKEFISVFLILFSIIDILGSLPLIITMKKQGKRIRPGLASIVGGTLMIVFLFVGEGILKLFGVDVASFALAGALVLFLIGIEMILGITLFRDEGDETSDSTIVPIAFPLIAGAGTLTTILTVKVDYQNINIILAIIANMIVVFIVLKSSRIISRKLGSAGVSVLRKVFGIILLAISIKIILHNFPGIAVPQ